MTKRVGLFRMLVLVGKAHFESDWPPRRMAYLRVRSQHGTTRLAGRVLQNRQKAADSRQALHQLLDRAGRIEPAPNAPLVYWEEYLESLRVMESDPRLNFADMNVIGFRSDAAKRVLRRKRAELETYAV